MKSLSISDFSENSISALRRFIEQDGKFVTLELDAPKGALPIDLPQDVLVTDLRYGGTTYIRGKHPRLEGYWTAYGGLTTGLARNVTFSQTITEDTVIEDSQSQPYEMQRAPGGNLASEEYRHLHNHHQLLHSEVFNFSRDLNAVSIWGDSAALAPGARSWGGFFSARSWPTRWTGYTPNELFAYDADMQFDASIIGIEIDVINGGKDWGVSLPNIGYACAKVGLQLVGFGKRNTAAIEVRTEDSDDPDLGPTDRRGAWNWGIIMRNSLHDQSTVLYSENGEIRRGIDFDKTTFTEGALRVTGAGPSSGIVFDAGKSGEMYSQDEVLNIRIGSKGLKIWNSDGTKVLLEITDDGIHLKPGMNFTT